MEHWLERIVEPDRLILAWQAPEGDRFRWAVGHVARDGSGACLTYLVAGPQFSALNNGSSFDDLRNAGYVGYPAFRLESRAHRDGVIQALGRRLPPRSRSDFGNYARHFRIPPGVDLSDFGLLGLTEAKLPNDGFSLVDPLNGQVDQCDLMLEVAGFRHYSADVGRLIELGEPAQIVPEPGNAHDRNAIMVRIGHAKVGNINRLQTAAFSTWLSNHSVEAWVERLNGKSDHPRLFIFVRVRPRMLVAA